MEKLPGLSFFFQTRSNFTRKMTQFNNHLIYIYKRIDFGVWGQWLRKLHNVEFWKNYRGLLLGSAWFTSIKLLNPIIKKGNKN